MHGAQNSPQMNFESLAALTVLSAAKVQKIFGIGKKNMYIWKN